MAARARGTRAGRRRGGGRATPGGPASLVSRVTGMLGSGSGRRSGSTGGGGLANRATSFVRGFMSGGGPARGRTRGRRRH
jgi:hypothetical protein